MNASHFRINPPPRACLTSLHICALSGTQLGHNLATAQALQQLTRARALQRPVLALPSSSRPRVPIGLALARPRHHTPARPLRLRSCELLRAPPTNSLARAAYIACAHATVCASLPCPSQRVSLALFLRSPQGCLFTAKTRHKAPSLPRQLTLTTHSGDTKL